MNFSKIIASFFGIGFIKKGGGTVAAFAFCVLLYLGEMFHFNSDIRLLFFSVFVLFLGVFVSRQTEKIWGEDSNKIVIDEVFGMAVSMLFLPVTLEMLFAAFILFRFFDIAKPLFIRKFEKFKNGWGVMLDDLVAGIYANIVIQIFIIIVY